MSLRREFVELARQEGANRRELCRRFGVSPQTGYKWLRRFEKQGKDGLEDRSRRPACSPRRTATWVEDRVVALRVETGWGGRKIRRVLLDEGLACAPSASTVSDILRRRGLLSPEDPPTAKWRRFEAAYPQELTQMDFKGHFPLLSGQRCHPFTMLDDRSRFCLSLKALDEESTSGVQRELTHVFRHHGLPRALLMDNGSPWGPREHLTELQVWLLRLGIEIRHSRPRHPQTLGKEERFHRSLQHELLDRRTFRDFADCQRAFNGWREQYNYRRPHEALGLDTPLQHYAPSPRSFPESLPPIHYDTHLQVRSVDECGRISFRGNKYRVGKALTGFRVGLEADSRLDGLFHVCFGSHRVKTIQLDTLK